MRQYRLPALALALVAAACGTEQPVAPTTAASDSADLEVLQSFRPEPKTGVQVSVIHGINGKDLTLPEALPVDVSVNGACALPGFTFRTITPVLDLPAGSYDIVVRLAAATPCTGTAVIEANDVALADGRSYSIIAHLSAAGAPTASVFENGLRSSFPALVPVSVRHAAQFGAVDVAVTNVFGRFVTVFEDVLNGQQGTVGVLPVRRTVAIRPAGTTTNAATLRFRPEPQKFYAVYAVGTPANGTFELLAQELAAPRRGR